MTQASTPNPAALGLVDGPSDAGLDDVADLVVETLHVPVALVSLVLNEEERQYFASRRGLPDSICETPISHSFCRHVKAADAPLVVANALQHPLVRNNPAITSLNVVAYLGMPIHDPKGRPIGALCAIDHVPREWGEADLSILSRLARLVTAQIRNRSVDMTERKTRSEIEEILERRARFFERVTHELRTPLNGVTGLLDVMQPDDLSDPNFVGQFREACDSMVAAANRLIDYVEAPPDLGTVPARFPGVRALVADDNRTNRFILERMLSPLGVEVAVVADGQDAIAAIMSTTFDVAFLDISMPGASGFDVLREIRAHQPDRVMVVAVTAHSLPEQVARYFEAGFDAHVAKPVRREAIIRELMKLQTAKIAA